MSSLTQSFALLNNAIRGISQDRRVHEERMEQLAFAKEKWNMEVNDPKRQFEKAKYAQQMEKTPVDLGLWSRNMSLSNHEQYKAIIEPAIKDILPEGTELNNKNQLVWEGTDEAAELPKWRVDALMAEVDMASAMAILGNNKLDIDIDNLERDISKMEDGLRGQQPANSKMAGIQLRHKKARLNSLIEERNDPQQQAKRLLTKNNELMKLHRAAMTHPNVGDKIFNAINTARTANLQEVKAIMGTIPKENQPKIREVTYTRVNPKTGVKSERKVYMTETELLKGKPPLVLNFGDGNYKWNSVSNLPSWKDLNDPEDGKLYNDLKPRQQDAVLKDVQTALRVISIANQELKDKDRIKEMLEMEGVSDEERNAIASALETNAADEKKNRIDQIKQYALKYPDAPFIKDLDPEIKKAIRLEQEPSKRVDKLGWFSK